MKRFILILTLSFICCSYSAYAQQGGAGLHSALQTKIKAKAAPGTDMDSLRYSLMVTKTPSNNFAPPPSAWDTFTGYFTNEEKNTKIKNIAAYLYNAYISNTLTAPGNAPDKLDFNYLGAADPLDYLLSKNNPGDLLSFYKKNKADIKKELKTLMQNKLGAAYNTQTDYAIEEGFINALLNTKDVRRHYGYLYSAKPALNNTLEDALKSELKKTQDNTVKKNRNTVATYQHVDPMAALDNANSFARKNQSAMTTTYRYVNDECALCTYTYCLNICANLNTKYQAWQIYRVYQISAYNLQDDYVLPSAGGDTFTTINGGQKKWDYHTAALILLKKDNVIKPVVVDTFLLEEPAPLDTWAQLFSTEKTLYNVSPFQRSAAVEKNIMDKKNLPKNATAHPVYN